MATSSETAQSPPLSSPGQGLKVREWSQYELDTVCALICKYEHRANPKDKKGKFDDLYLGDQDGELPGKYIGGWVLSFATKLNEAFRMQSHKHQDIASADVKELMDFIETKNEAVMNYIHRQSAPFRVTRAKKFAFQRLYHTFDKAFFKWTLSRRQRHRSANNSDDEDLLTDDQVNHLGGVTGIEENWQPEVYTQRNHTSNSIYAQRSRDGQTTPSTDQDGTAYPSPPRTRAPRQRWLRRRNHRRGQLHIPPPPPPPPPPHEGSTQNNYTDAQPFTANEAGAHCHPPWPTYHEQPCQGSSTMPLAPLSPAYFGHAGLGQSIHPTGPRPESLLLTYDDHQELEQPGSSGAPMLPVYSNSYNTPAHSGYEYPEPQQEVGSYDYNSVFETPTSPVYEPRPMVGVSIEAQSPFTLNYNNGYSNHYEPSSGGCGTTEFLDY